MSSETKGITQTRLQPRAVGSKDLVFFVVSAAAPLTGMAGFVALVFLFGGVIAPSGYIIAGAVYALFAVGFTAMSKHVRNSGAFYAYITAGLGSVAGSGAAVVAYLAYALGQIGFTAAAGVFASGTVKMITGLDVSWQVCAVTLGLVVAGLSARKVAIGAKVLGLLLALEIGVLLVFAVAVIAVGGHEGFTFASFDPTNFATPSIGALFLLSFMVFIGFEQTAVYGEEARNPARTVRRATFVSVGLLAGLYTVISWTVLVAAGPSRLESLLAGDPSALMFNLNTEFVGEGMTAVMMVLIVTSFFAGTLGPHNAATRYLFSLGRDGVVPAVFARTGTSTRTPTVAGAVHTTFVIGLLVLAGFTPLDPYSQIIVWANTPTLIGVIVLEIATSVAVVRYLSRVGTGETRWRRQIAPILAAVLLTGALVLIIVNLDVLTGLGFAGNMLVLSPLAVGFTVGCVRALRGRRNDPAPPEIEAQSGVPAGAAADG